MNPKDVQNLRLIANFISFCLLIVGLVLQSYVWLLAALIMRRPLLTFEFNYSAHKHNNVSNYSQPKRTEAALTQALARMNKNKIKASGLK